MEKIVKKDGKIILIRSNDGSFRHTTEYIIGTYEEKPKEEKNTKKKKAEE